MFCPLLFQRCCSRLREAIAVCFCPDLVSRGSNECWGTNNSTSQTGWGAAYENNCIHSGTIKISGDLPSNWYNYSLASAGTVIDKNTDSEHPATNTTKATESICPKGWTLPTTEQISTNHNVSTFSPVLGGTYYNGDLGFESTRGYWWGSEAYTSGLRFSIDYDGNDIYRNRNPRINGRYIRCVPAP